MKFFKLQSTYAPGDTLQTFDSLVWSERYLEPGDFELVMEGDISLLKFLPMGTLVSHTDTKEVMIVENHEIVRDADKKLTVKVTGRSFETFAENRVTAGSEMPLNTSGVANVETIAAAPSATIAAQLLKGRMEPGTASAANAIPNLRVLTEMRTTDASMAQVIQRGDLYSRVVELLRLNDAGLKNKRPGPGETTLDLSVHDGIDRIATVIFYAQYEDLLDAQYFMSAKDIKNYASIATDVTQRLYRTRSLAADVNGLARKVEYVEATDLKGTYSPATASDVVASRAQAALDEYKGCYMISARVSATARPKFKIHYDVGDLVTVFGEFQIAQTMRVTEHILTVDADGERGFPSLSGL